MNAGITEEAGKVATGFIDALRGQPAILALIVANIAMLAFVFYALHGAATFRTQILTQQFEYQKEVNEILSKCVVPGRTGALDEEPRKLVLPVREPERPTIQQGTSEPERRLLNGEEPNHERR